MTPRGSYSRGMSAGVVGRDAELARLDEVLVRNEKIATGVQAGLYAFQRVGIFNVQATVKPGVDPALVERRLDELVAEYIANGPTEEEVRRAALSEVGGKIRSTIISPGAVDSELKHGSSNAQSASAVIDFYEMAIPADAVARAIAYAIMQPADVDINEIVLRPTAQEF